MSYPTIDEVVSFLTEHGQPAMANLVSRTQDQLDYSRSLNQSNVDAYNALKNKYEPQFRYPDYRPPIESTD